MRSSLLAERGETKVDISPLTFATISEPTEEDKEKVAVAAQDASEWLNKNQLSGNDDIEAKQEFDGVVRWRLQMLLVTSMMLWW